MFRPRKIESHRGWADPSGIKIYTISAKGQPVDQSPYLVRLAEAKRQKPVVDWSTVPSFAVFHDGASMAYLVLAWWGNDNELFTSVSVLTSSGWIEDPTRHSFCVYDLEIMWQERNYFIECIDCEKPDLEVYRAKRFNRVDRADDAEMNAPAFTAPV